MSKKISIIKEYPFSKIGIDEVVGLKATMHELIQPVVDAIKDHIYWNDDLAAEETEYVGRDGFIPYSHNCGGFEISLIIPSCERDTFPCLEYGECEDEECDHEVECVAESEGHFDAKLQVWFKFEGIEDGEMKFYLYLGGGNGDAPYFRTGYEATIFERSFSCKSLAGLKRKATPAIRELINALAVRK